MREPLRLSFIGYSTAAGQFFIRPAGVAAFVGVSGAPLDLEYSQGIAMHRMAILRDQESEGRA